MTEGTIRASKETWDESLPAERADWGTLTWQKQGREERISEWTRHLEALDLRFDQFTDEEILDVGCGPTGIAYFLESKRRVGLDPLADHFEQWNGFWGEPIELVQAQAEAMPFADASFDTVFCINCVDHAQDGKAVIDELARVTRPCGLMVFQVDLDSPLRTLHKRVSTRCRVLHPLALDYKWVIDAISAHFDIVHERRDPQTFRMSPDTMRYEAYWDGLLYRITRSPRWMHHVWLTARRHS